MSEGNPFGEPGERTRGWNSEPISHREGSEQLASSVLDSVSASIAILDEHGDIIETNHAWREFGRSNGIRIAPDAIGINYLAICERASGDSADKANEAALGIRSVLAGEINEFVMDYPCHSPGRKRWCYMRAIRFAGSGPPRIVVSHEDVTPLKLAEEALRNREHELRLQKKRLEEANVALKVLLKHREEDKRELEEKVVSNVNRLVRPYLDKLKGTRLLPEQRAYLGVIEHHLGDIIAPFLQRLPLVYRNLTPQEIQVAALVRNGKMTKEIADILNISTNAVDFHRKNIRKKLGLSTKKLNLRTHLLSLTE